MIDDFKINGFDMDVFIHKFIPVVVLLVVDSFDPSSKVFIVNITNSLIALIDCRF